MDGDPNVYKPSPETQSGARLTDLVQSAVRLREHLWVATAAWAVSDPADPGPLLLDRNNLLTVPGVGCYVCEQVYSPQLARRRCPGES